LSFLSGIRHLFSKDKSFVRALRNLLGFTPRNLSLYHLAFKHRSTAEEHPSGIKMSNERLEYLGDAVLGAIIAEHLFKRFPFREEGFLTEMRSRLVNREQLNKLAVKIGVVYLDQGYNVTRQLVLNRIFRHHIDVDVVEQTDSNFKSKLINWCQKEKRTVDFELVEEVENGGKRLLRVRVLVNGEEVAQGEDFSKKRAEQIAAEKAIGILGIS